LVASLNTEIATISNALTLVKNLRGVAFKRAHSGKRGIGVIAEELDTVMAEAVKDISCEVGWRNVGTA
jgi:hypothetical protein